MTQSLSLITRRPSVREALIFLAFLGLTVAMTWPWIAHLRDAASDAGDPYLNAWTMWWDYHQTFHDPLNLFHANIFYPYRYTLAFSEHDYGIALLFFPLFALGLRPLTIHGIATLFGIAFCGYGAFRLARTLTASNGVAWVTGIAFAFVSYRFGQLPHLNYLFAGWIPVLLEALVLFLRDPTRKRAAWLGVAFFMNGMTCVHWFVLTLIPLGLSATVLLVRYNKWRDARLWRGLVATGTAALGLVPFLLPYQRAAQLYSFVRNPQEALLFSATPLDWLVGDFRNKMWHGLNAGIRRGERALFPGLLPLLLALAAVFLFEPQKQDERAVRYGSRLKKRLLVCLDALAIIDGILIVIISGYGPLKLRMLGFTLISIHDIAPLMVALLLTLFLRILIAYPEVIKRPWKKNLVSSLRSERRSDAFCLGLIWTLIGYFGSLGMNFPFHRFLYQYVPLFRSIRVPARWAMICCLGLALLAGVGAKQLTDLLRRQWSWARLAVVYLVIALGLLVEQRVAPLELIHGAADPDALTIWLKQTPMAGGIVEIPSAIGRDANYLYVLRSADHEKPLVTAISGFSPPIQNEIQSLTESDTIPDRFIDLLESIPCSYLVIHNTFLRMSERFAFESVLGRGITAGRLRFIRSYEGADLYAVTRTEPKAISEAQTPFPVHANGVSLLPEKDAYRGGSEGPSNPIDDGQFFIRTQYLDFLEREPDPDGLNYWLQQFQIHGKTEEERARISAAFFIGPEFQETGFFVYRVYKATLGRPPTYAEFKTDRARLIGGPNLEAGKNAFIDAWTKGPQFSRFYSSQSTAEQFVDALLRTVRETSASDLEARRRDLIDELNHTGSRAQVVREVVDDGTFRFAEYNRAFVLMQYFGYLKRDPDADGYAFWLNALNKQERYAYWEMVQVFITSKEYRLRFARP